MRHRWGAPLVRPQAVPLSDHAAGFDPYLHPYTYDPERARELLREAGHGNGFKTTLAYNISDPLGDPVSAQLRSAFKDVGVTLELEALPSSTYTDALFTGKRPMFFFQGGADSPDPAYALGVFYESKSSNNWGGYKSAKADACLAGAGRPQLAWDQRVEKHKRCAEIIAQEAPWLWIAQPGFQVSTRSAVTGSTGTPARRSTGPRSATRADSGAWQRRAMPRVITAVITNASPYASRSSALSDRTRAN